ncbi:MAG TPA: RHS repeat-associated core domain-containing protein, partial [Chloroflexota bacterium]|nr:RHS repeat-associated core domain-containing protein [Chloroflexota bacterium]
GQQLDPNLGFYFLRARYYAPALGRFLSRDPFPGNAFDPPSLHPYLFVRDNPVNRADPSGEQDIIGAAIAASIISVFVGIATYAITGNIWTTLKAMAWTIVIAFVTFLLLPALLETFQAGWTAALSYILRLTGVGVAGKEAVQSTTPQLDEFIRQTIADIERQGEQVVNDVEKYWDKFK